VKGPPINFQSLILVIVWLVIACPATVTANAIEAHLRQTMADISLLNNQLAQRKSDATGIRDALATRLAEIKKEACLESQEKGVKSAAEALKNPRILYDLMLMAEISACIDRYTQKIGYYRVACDRLSYLYQQADDDLKIVNTLSGMKIDALISQVEKILDGYLRDAQTITIQADTLTLEPPEKMWATLCAG
jgi:hypothetical protein